MNKSSKKNIPPRHKAKNRKRQGYELTRQRDMLPVLLGGVSAAVLVHIFACYLAPRIWPEPNAQSALPETVQQETKRVYFKTKIEPLTPEPEPEPEPEKALPEIVEQPKDEKRDIDIFEEPIAPTEIRPGDTHLIVKAEMKTNLDFSRPMEQASTELSVEKIKVEEKKAEEALLSDDIIPLNANDTVVNLAPMNSDIAKDGTTTDEEKLKETASQGMDDMPEDTRTLDELHTIGNLSSQSGVARMEADVLFDFNSVTLQQSALVTMVKLAGLIQVNPDTYFIIEGHSDGIGSASKNALISMQRAEAVRTWLAEMGVPMERVRIRVCAANSPLVSLKGTEEQQKLNRRIEIHMRSLEEGVPEGCLDSKNTIPLDKNLTQLLNEGFPIPQTYKTLSIYAQKSAAAPAEQPQEETENTPKQDNNETKQ
ncbi:MAG: OmpA family protein [Akkermansiaceae bacterium]|nr:OmpA family protein [Akkermansiaceae bacterium]